MGNGSRVLLSVKGHVRGGKFVRPYAREVVRALRFAGERHGSQKRADGVTPYIAHPAGVVSILRHVGGITDKHTLAAAALHDVVEDTNTTLDEIRVQFGPEVAELITHVTNNPKLRGEAIKADAHERILRAPPGAQQIKLADKISNMTDALVKPPPYWKDSHFLRYMKYSEMLANAMIQVHPRLAAALLQIVDRAKRSRPTKPRL